MLEIWHDYRNETENQPMFHRLPEPPAARDRLKQEIKFFVDSVREKSGQNGRYRNAENILIFIVFIAYLSKMLPVFNSDYVFKSRYVVMWQM